MTVRFARAIAVGLATPLIAGAVLFAGVDRLEAQTGTCRYIYDKALYEKCLKDRARRIKPGLKPMGQVQRADKPARQEGVGRGRRQ
jgi:hypothetical protein